MKTIIRGLLSIAAACIATPSFAQTSVREFSLDIDHKPLAAALTEFSKQTGLQIWYFPQEPGENILVGPLSGRFTADAAITELLLQSGLSYERLNERTIAVMGRETTEATRFGVSTLERRMYQRTAPSFVHLTNARLAEAPAAEEGEEELRIPANARETEDIGRRRGALEEVIVTAQKREERLIDTPISIGVLSGELLDRTSSRGVADVLNQVGGVTMTEVQPGNVQIVVRGVVPGPGQNTTAYYQDEVPFGFVRVSELPDSNAFDLARVEVLRGPQGTLYGANSLSGVVRILTNDANLNDFQVKGRTRVSSTEDGGGNYGGDLAVNVPLIPGELAIRGVVGYSELSGYIDSSLDGHSRINDTTAQNYRFKMNWQPGEDLSMMFGYSRSEIDNGALSNSLDDFTTPFSSNQPNERVLNMYSLVAEYQWSSVSLLSSTGYIDYANESQRDLLLGGTRATLLERGPLRSFSQELRLSSHLEGAWQWSAGAFYKDATHQIENDVRPFFPAVLLTFHQSESYAVFGEATRSFNDDRFELTAGVRYFEDRVIISPRTGFNPAAPLAPETSTTFARPTGRLVFAYKPQASSTFYGSIATGFRSGLHQSAAIVLTNPELPAVDPDSVTSYELGAKGLLFDGAISYDTAVYYTDWDDIQQALAIPPLGLAAFVNAGGASGVGVDAAVSYQPTRALTLQASIGWNDLRIDEDVLQFVPALQQSVVLLAKDSRPNESPEWTGSVGASYRVATPKTGVSAVLSSNFAYGSQRVARSLVLGVVRETQSDEMRILKASIGLESDRWSLDIYADNLLNDDAAITAPSVTSANTAVRLRPRTIGLQVTFDY